MILLIGKGHQAEKNHQRHKEGLFDLSREKECSYVFISFDFSFISILIIIMITEVERFIRMKCHGGISIELYISMLWIFSMGRRS